MNLEVFFVIIILLQVFLLFLSFYVSKTYSEKSDHLEKVLSGWMEKILEREKKVQGPKRVTIIQKRKPVVNSDDEIIRRAKKL